MDKDVNDTIDDCRSCQAVGPKRVPTPLIPSPLPDHQWQQVSLDLFGPLPSGEKLLVIIDLYSAALIDRVEKIFCMFGYPKVVRVDNGPPFNSRTFRQYLEFNDITKKSITPYYPQANGTVERFMRVIKKTVRTAFYENKNWRKELNTMLLNYRTASHCVTGKSPAYLLFSREINNKLPSITKEIHTSDKAVRDRIKQRYI